MQQIADSQEKVITVGQSVCLVSILDFLPTFPVHFFSCAVQLKGQCPINTHTHKGANHSSSPQRLFEKPQEWVLDPSLIWNVRKHIKPL